MVRICGALIRSFVTRVAISGSSRKLPIDVTAVARHVYVRAGEREPSRVVIKAGRGPGRRCVADLALLRETGLSMIRVCRAVVVFEVTGHAGRVCN